MKRKYIQKKEERENGMSVNISPIDILEIMVLSRIRPAWEKIKEGIQELLN